MTMQDRFKFRFWNTIRNKYEDTYCCSSKGMTLDYVIPEQCTGLKDKNGKLIYEGDIVRTSYPYAVKNYEVKWGDCCWELRKEKGFIVLYEKISEVLEVIGNIHENPDLLENKNE